MNQTTQTTTYATPIRQGGKYHVESVIVPAIIAAVAVLAAFGQCLHHVL